MLLTCVLMTVESTVHVCVRVLVCNVKERTMVVQGHFKVNQDRRFWHQSMRAYDFLLVINSNLGSVLHRFGDTVPIRTYLI